MIEGDELLHYVDDNPIKVVSYLREVPIGQGKGALLNRFENQVPEELEVAEMYGAGKYTLQTCWSVEEKIEGSTKTKVAHRNKTETYNISKRAGFTSNDSMDSEANKRMDRLESAVLKLAESPKQQESMNPLDLVKLVLSMQSNNNSGSETIALLEKMYVEQIGGVMEKGREMQTLAHEQSLELTRANSASGGKKSLLEYVEEYIPVIQGFLKMPMGTGTALAKSQLSNNPEIKKLMSDPDQVASARAGLSKHFSPEDVKKINKGFFPEEE